MLILCLLISKKMSDTNSSIRCSLTEYFIDQYRNKRCRKLKGSIVMSIYELRSSYSSSNHKLQDVFDYMDNSPYFKKFRKSYVIAPGYYNALDMRWTADKRSLDFTDPSWIFYDDIEKEFVLKDPESGVFADSPTFENIEYVAPPIFSPTHPPWKKMIASAVSYYDNEYTSYFKIRDYIGSRYPTARNYIKPKLRREINRGVEKGEVIKLRDSYIITDYSPKCQPTKRLV